MPEGDTIATYARRLAPWLEDATILQARDPAWDGRTFLARHDRQAMWLDDLEPLHGDRFEWEPAPRLTG